MDNSRGYIFISDAHLNSVDEHTEAFNSLLRKSWEENVEVFLLGDIFDLWFGIKSLTFPFQQRVINEIASLAEKGLRIYYVEGNRDFFLVGSWVEGYFTEISDNELPLRIGPKNIMLVHGDRVSREDLKYRFWKAISKNPIIFRVFSLIPGKIALPVAEAFEKGLKSTNPRFRYHFPEEEGRAYAKEQFKRGFDIIIMGHFHREKVISPAEYDRSRMLVFLPMWKENRRYFYMDNFGGFGFRNYREGSPLIG